MDGAPHPDTYLHYVFLFSCRNKLIDLVLGVVMSVLVAKEMMYGTLLPPGQDVFVLLMVSAYQLQFCLSCNFGIFSPRLPWLEMRRRANAA